MAVVVPASARQVDWAAKPPSAACSRTSTVDVEDWPSAIDIILRRFAEYHALEGAFGRRALIERAKSIPHGTTIGPDAARAELRRGAGSQFDADVVVDALLAVLARESALAHAS